MQKLLLSIVLILGITSISFSQLEEKMRSERVVPGIVYTEEGELEGYLRKNNVILYHGKSFSAPWIMQNQIYFIPKDVFENSEKIKNKMYTKYTGKDCVGYMMDSIYYESVKYSHMGTVSVSMVGKKIFLQKISDGKISLYHYFLPPPDIASGPDGFEPYYISSAEPNLVYQVGKEGKLKLVNDLNIEKELADCLFVVDRHKSGEYKPNGGEGEGKGLNKLVNNTMFREEVRLLAIQDYNERCN